MDERQQEVLRQRQAQISSVMNHPGWDAWVDEAKRKIEKLRHRATLEALSLHGADQRKLDRIAGFIEGIEYSYKMPMSAESALTKFMRELEAGDERAGH